MATHHITSRYALGRGFAAALAVSLSGLVQSPPTLADAETYSPGAQAAIPRTVYWGDTHLHTRNSFDAYNLGNIDLSPEDAYRFARGEQVTSQTGLVARLRRPLDFLVVADHAAYLAAFYRYAQGDAAVAESAAGRRWSAMASAAERFADVVESIREPEHLAPLPEATQRSIWLEEVVRVADRHNAYAEQVAAELRSADLFVSTRASSRCSVETYSSFIRSASV